MTEYILADSINELSDLSRRLNQKSDTLNATITSINEKLAKLNLGVEVWLVDSPIENGDFDNVDENGARIDPEADATLLGYCRCENGWHLAVKEVTLHERSNSNGFGTYLEAADSHSTRGLLQASREIRLKAASKLPKLLDEIEREATALLEGIEKAEKAAAKL